jgi:hypothetical protein
MARTPRALGVMPLLPKVLLDTNGIIDIEEARADAPYVAALVLAAQQARIQLAVAAISASENQPGGTISQDYSEFEGRLRRTGLSEAIELHPLLHWDVGYWDHCIWGSDEDIALAESIRQVLFPGQPPLPGANDADSRKWRNQLCDAMMVWCGIHYRCDCLVTRDERLIQRKADLLRLGLKDVLHPRDAATLYAAKG